VGRKGKEGLESAGPPTFEQGPIRPPSEARSLLLRVTRNCPWNRCEFCPVYKGSRFSRRSVDQVEQDIRAMAWWHEKATEESWRLGYGGRIEGDSLSALYRRQADNPYMRAVLIWLSGGGKTAFLQDADNLILKPPQLVQMLKFLRQTFPSIERVTTYSRSRTCYKRTVDELGSLKEAGLDRVHVGLESGSDKVLEKVKKGATAEVHIQGGRNVVEAGLELSEYIMPGLGGRELSTEHALETARVLSAINPHFIRIRSLGIREGIILWDRWKQGEFEPMDDEEIAAELKLIIENLENIGSRIVSDHILNLLPEVEGKLPEDKERIIAAIDRFLALPEEERMTYVVGRRFGLFQDMEDMKDPAQYAAAKRTLERLRKEGGHDVHATIRQIVSRFI